MDFIPVNEPLLNGNEKKYLCECIDTGWISSEGPFIKEFEHGIADRVGRNYGIAVSNGTAALEVAVQALDIGEGDEVIMPTFTIISCAMAVTKRGGRPVFVDSDPVTWNMNVDEIEAKITEKTKAIMAVHIYGLPVDMNPIINIAQKYDLKIIEDAAEMIGQTYYDKPCGSFGDISTFSFYPNKHVTTGEGGMVLTDDEEIAERCRQLRNLCFRKDVRYVHDEISDNYRFTNLQAAVGVAQLERLNEFIEKKRWIGSLYNELLADVKGISLPLKSKDYAENIYWVYGIVLDEDRDLTNLMLQKRLSDEGIGTRTFFYPMHKQPVYINKGMYIDEHYRWAEMLAERGLYLPSGLALTEQQINVVVKKLKKCLEG